MEAIFPVIPSEIPKRAADTIGRVPAFRFDESTRRRSIGTDRHGGGQTVVRVDVTSKTGGDSDLSDG